MSDWGKGSENNNIGWGQAAGSATNNWGESQKTSWAGQTDIVGLTTLNISYSADNYCEDGGNTPQPTVSNNVGAGTFSSTAGLVIDANTGVINTDTSTVGSYVVTYTDTNAATATDSVDILALPNVIVSTSDGTICVGESTILTASGASTYVWNDGVTLNPRTVSPTTTTTYTATGNDGFCTSAGSTTITVNALPSVSISGTLTYCAGIGASTTLDAGAGFASYSWSSGETTQTISATAGNYTVTVTDSNGCSNTSAQVTVTETPLDVATVVYDSSSYCQMPTGALAVEGYYPLYSTESASNAVSSDGTSHSHTLGGTTYYMPNAGIVVYHGTYSLTATPTITGESGTFNSPSGLSIDANGVIDKNASTAGTYSVEYTTTGSCPITITNSITITALDNATFAYGLSAYCDNVSDPTPTKSATGTFSSSTGLSINTSTGEVDLDASTAGTYVIGFVTNGSCPNSSIQTLTINAAPTVAISGTLSYCAGSNTTLTATAGLSSYLWSSGETTQSITATAGSYTVTGTDANGCSNTSSSVTVTETPLDNAAFAYSASSYEPTDADPTPTITGLTGGTFSAGSGLVFVDSGTNTGSSTGEIDLSASTVASYTITYDTTSSGSSVCPNTSTQTVEIAVAGFPNNYSMNFDIASSDYINAGSSLDVTGTITFSAWINIDSAATGGNILFSSGTTSGNHIQIGYNRGGYEGRILVSTTASYWDTDNSVMSSVLSLNTWYHLVVTKVWDGSDNVNNIYINGSLDSSSPSIGNYWGANTTTNTLIGVGGSAFLQYKYFDGKMDELAVWNTALTSTQIAEIYNAKGTNLTKDLTTVSGSNLVYWNRMGD